MRVGVDTTPQMLGLPGVGRYTKELVAAVAREPGVEVERLGAVASRTSSPMRSAEWAARGIVYYPVELGRHATRRGVEVVHLPAPIAPVRVSVPLVVTVHDMLPWRYPEGYRRLTLTRERLFTKRIVRSAARVLVASESTRTDVIDVLGVDPGRVVVVAHGVDGRFSPHQTSPSNLAHRFGIPPGPFVLWVGTTEPRKNLTTLLRAFSLVRRRHPDLSLVLVGEWGTDDETLARELDRMSSYVIRPGFVSDDELAYLYSATACFVYPSLYEGFGLPPLEAMACGAPVVAANVSSIPEVVGDAGLLVDPHDPDGFADAMEDVLGSTTRQADLRQRGLERANQFTWSRAAAETVAQYRAAIG